MRLALKSILSHLVSTDMLGNASNNLIYLLLALIVCLFIWSNVMSIESAVKSQGTVVTSEQRKIVTHYEGGVIDKIFVEEGQKVKKGESLMSINNLSIDERSQQKEMQVSSLSAKLKRLEAEIAGADSFILVEDNVFAEQEQKAFKIRLDELKTRTAIIRDRISQKKIDLDDFASKKINLQKQKDIFQQQYELLSGLVKEEAASLNMLLEKESELVGVNRQLLEVNYAIERYKIELKELHKEIEYERDRYTSSAKSEYDEAVERFRDSETQLTVSRERQHRSLLTSPHEGIIYKIHSNTLGETVKSGQVLIEIVPETRKLIVKAKIVAEDRDQIWDGMNAKVSPVYRDFSSKPIEAEVLQVSADSTFDEVDRRRYFDVILESDSFVKNKHRFIASGMMVDVSIITGEHRLMEYLLRPVLRGWDTMFSEPI